MVGTNRNRVDEVFQKQDLEGRHTNKFDLIKINFKIRTLEIFKSITFGLVHVKLLLAIIEL